MSECMGCGGEDCSGEEDSDGFLKCMYREQPAYAAGVAAERARVVALVEGRISFTGALPALKALRLLLAQIRGDHAQGKEG